MGARRGAALVLALGGLTLLPAGAGADHHLMKVREVGSGPIPYVELQAYAPFQTVLGGHTITYYDSVRRCVADLHVPGLAARRAAQHRRPTHVSDLERSTRGCHGRLLGSPCLSIPVAGGALCFDTVPTSFTDCVSWGSFTGAGMLPSPSGTPVSELRRAGRHHPHDRAGLRDVARGRRRFEQQRRGLLDRLSHSAQQRHPADRDRLRWRRWRGRWRRRRRGRHTSPPETNVTKGPDKSTNKRKVKIRFESSESGSTFMCRLDKRAFKACASPFKKRVDEGRHKFLVYAIDAAGNSDQTPAKLKFRVVGD